MGCVAALDYQRYRSIQYGTAYLTQQRSQGRRSTNAVSQHFNDPHADSYPISAAPVSKSAND
jgi:hypothetical protein